MRAAHGRETAETAISLCASALWKAAKLPHTRAQLGQGGIDQNLYDKKICTPDSAQISCISIMSLLPKGQDTLRLYGRIFTEDELSYLPLFRLGTGLAVRALLIDFNR